MDGIRRAICAKLFCRCLHVALMPYGVVWKDERRTFNIERPTSNEKQISNTELWWIRKKSQVRHAGLDPASRTYWNHWIPAFAGMTERAVFQLFTSSSTLMRILPLFCLSFKIRCWTFDVRCSFFQLLLHKNNLTIMGSRVGEQKGNPYPYCGCGNQDGKNLFQYPRRHPPAQKASEIRCRNHGD